MLLQVPSAAWILLVLAVVLANAPFLTRKLFGFKTLTRPKSFAWILLEWALAYVLLLAVGMLFEAAIGQNSSQRWEFFAVTLSLFATLAFPGFVWRFLWQR